MVVYRRCSTKRAIAWNAERSALQTLHKASSKAREENYFQGGLSHEWVDYYEQRIESDRSCLNEWHAMEDLESRRPPSPDSVRTKPCKRDETEKVIRSTLKEIMMCVDLDEVTSKYIRNRLEEELDMDLAEYKSFIDEEMLIILGQMDAPTEIFDHVYLGSEWNASNYEELKKNGVRHILNVTREIDNFFPGTFDYLNIRVYDDEKTDLLKYWDNTYKYITKARTEGSKVLVHCKMGISRSASVVIAYAMKAYNWDFKTAMQHVKEKRTCIKPNVSFVAQLETYQGILDAMKNKEKLQRSKSDTNLKSPERTLPGSQPTPLLQALSRSAVLKTTSGQDLRQLGSRPKSWSPENASSNDLLLGALTPFRSLENLNRKSLSKESLGSLRRHKSATKLNSVVRNVLLPCDNGESYSVSPNQIRHLPGQLQGEKTTVKQIVDEFEAQKDVKECRKKVVSNNLVMPDDFGPSPVSSCNNLTEEAQLRLTPPMLRAVLVKKEIWDPGEIQVNPDGNNDSSTNNNFCDFNSLDNKKLEQTIWTSSTVLQMPSELQNSAVEINKVPDIIQNKTKTIRRDSDVFSNQVDRVFDREEKRQQRISAVAPLPEDTTRNCPSRQSSWGSYDSAVVLGESRDLLSRHSSWGSGDTRTLPSRNSSWGSYDMRPGGFNEKSEKVLNPEDWGAYTAKRNDTVEALNVALIQEKENEIGLNNSGSAISAEIDIINPKRSFFVSSCRLSVSAPENSSINVIPQECALSRSTNVINTAQCFSVKQHKNFLESLGKDTNILKKPDDLSEPEVGIVRSLKKEFEAKTNQEVNNVLEDLKTKSVPSSPVEKSPSRTNSEEDLSFKKLIGKFELNTKDVSINRRPKLCSSQKSHKNSRFSCIEVSTEKNPIRVTQTPLIKNIERPPVPPVKNPSPNVVVATVIAKAAMKQQQYGKSHPLARINIKPRHNNPVYNTM